MIGCRPIAPGDTVAVAALDAELESGANRRIVGQSADTLRRRWAIRSRSRCTIYSRAGFRTQYRVVSMGSKTTSTRHSAWQQACAATRHQPLHAYSRWTRARYGSRSINRQRTEAKRMYLDHYGLDQPPFGSLHIHSSSDCRVVRRGATLDALVYAILHDEGIVKCAAEVGSGKTMFCRGAHRGLPDSVGLFFTSAIRYNRAKAPLRQIADELAIPVASDHSGALLSAIQSELISRFAAGRRIVALIDEAHAMPPASLEQIRLLSNLEPRSRSCCRSILFGQPESPMLARHLATCAQLWDRITQNFRLDPLGAGEVSQYIDFRLRTAGYRGPSISARGG